VSASVKGFDPYSCQSDSQANALLLPVSISFPLQFAVSW